MVFLKIKVNFCILINPINIYNFWGVISKYPILLKLLEKIEKNIANQTAR